MLLPLYDLILVLYLRGEGDCLPLSLTMESWTSSLMLLVDRLEALALVLLPGALDVVRDLPHETKFTVYMN